MPVKTGAQPLLVQKVRNQPNTPAEDEETVQNAHLQVVLSFLVGEGARVAEEVHKAHGDTAVHVQNQIVLFGGCDRLYGNGVV